MGLEINWKHGKNYEKKKDKRKEWGRKGKERGEGERDRGREEERRMWAKRDYMSELTLSNAGFHNHLQGHP